MSQTFKISNRQKLDLVIEVDEPAQPKGLVFIAHGLKGTRNQPHIQAFKRAFLANDFRVVRFDATHSVGESDGSLEDVTFDSYVHDLEDVIDWARQQKWFTQPFALCGHSMGAQSTGWYGAAHPEEISMLLPMAPVINFELYSQTHSSTELAEWQQSGTKQLTSSMYPNKILYVKYALIDSLKRYNLLDVADKLTMPLLNIVGSEDQPCRPAHQQLFMEAVKSHQKELKIIDGLEHSYRNAKTDKVDTGLSEVETIVRDWIKQVN